MSLDIYGKHSLGEQIEFELVLSAMYEEELLNVTKLLSKDQKLNFINTVQEVLLMDVVSDEYAKKVMSEFDIKIYDNIAQSYLSTTSSNDIIIANTRRVVCSQCGLPLGRAIDGESQSGSLYYCRKCKGYRRVEVNTVTVP